MYSEKEFKEKNELDSVYDLLVDLTLTRVDKNIQIDVAIEECRHWCRLPASIVCKAIQAWAETGVICIDEEKDRLSVIVLDLRVPSNRFRACVAV